jgi:hypothetical protein
MGTIVTGTNPAAGSTLCNTTISITIL